MKVLQWIAEALAFAFGLLVALATQRVILPGAPAWALPAVWAFIWGVLICRAASAGEEGKA